MQKSSRSMSARAAALLATVLISSGAPARATDYAYMITGNNPINLGVVDLSSGDFSLCGPVSTLMAGLGVGRDHNLYGGAAFASGLYRITPTNGAITLISNSNVTYFLFGSTKHQIYAVGTDSNTYSIDYQTGAATLLGPLGLTINPDDWWGMSTNSNTLYVTHNSTLYRVNVESGAASEIGKARAGNFLGLIQERGILYGGTSEPQSIYVLNPKTGASTFQAKLSGTGVAAPWGFAPIKEQSISAKNICKAHKIP